jgi:hypothetical protein
MNGNITVDHATIKRHDNGYWTGKASWLTSVGKQVYKWGCLADGKNFWLDRKEDYYFGHEKETMWAHMVGFEELPPGAVEIIVRAIAEEMAALAA